VLFERRLQAGLSTGTIRLAFRRWRRAQVVSGRRYRSPIGLIEISSVRVVDEAIPPEDALAAGYASVADLLADLAGPSDARIFRLELRPSSEPDPRDQLAQDARLDQAQLRQLLQQLARLDHRRSWTLETLRAIEARPGCRNSSCTSAS
jgi:hypothetical protein